MAQTVFMGMNRGARVLVGEKTSWKHTEKKRGEKGHRGKAGYGIGKKVDGELSKQKVG